MHNPVTLSAPPQTNAARGDFVVRRGTFFQIGEYPDKQFALTEAEADAAIACFAPVPLNIEHIPTIFDGKLGMVQRLWREGKNILAEYAIPRWLHEVTQGEAIKISSEWGRTTKCPQGGAFVLNPRVTDAVMQAAFKRFDRFDRSDRFDGLNGQKRWDQSGRNDRGSNSTPGSEAEPELEPGKELQLMSLLTGIKTLFQRVGVPAHEIEAHLHDAPIPMSAEPVQDTLKGDAGTVHNDANPATRTDALPNALTDEQARFAALEAELVRLRAEALNAQQDREAARFAADAQIIEGWVRGLKMTPAEAESWREIARDKPAAFAAIVPVLEARSPLPLLTGPTVRASETADVERLETLTRQRMKEKEMDHTAAFKEVCAENRELALSVRMKSQEGN